MTGAETEVQDQTANKWIIRDSGKEFSDMEEVNIVNSFIYPKRRWL